MPDTNLEKRQVIEKIYEDRAKNDSNTVSLAQSIRSFSYDALSGEKYLAELLQNADDAKSSSVSWTLTKSGYLILIHEGKVFTEEDIYAICDHASSKRKKVTDTEQIGNKGVGFKAVFTVAETVYIFSDGYHFRFDEKHLVWQDCVEAYPWQIIPIWTNPDEITDIKSSLELEKTCFVFKLRQEIFPEVSTHLEKLNSRHLLFLRYVKQMSITLPDKATKKLTLTAPQLLATNILNLTRISSEQSDWLVYQSQIIIPEEVRAKLKEGQNIPEKYKETSMMPLQIAILAKDNKLLPVPDGQKVFCYLPTDLDLGLAVLVNAEFLLEPSRMHLREGVAADAWNQWMLTSLWQTFIQFLSLLAIHTKYAHDIFLVLTDPAKIAWGNLERFKAACVANFKSLIEKTPLVRNLPDQKILTVTNIKLDWTRYIQQFGLPSEQETTAHPSMKNAQLIRDLGAHVFWIDDIIKAVQTPVMAQTLKDPQLNKKFLECLQVLEERIKQEALTQKIKTLLKNTALILSARNELKKVSEIFFPEETLRYALASDEFLDLLHANIYASKVLKAWLNRMGMNAITLEEIVKMVNKEPKYAVQFTIHLVQSAAWKKLDASRRDILKSLRLKTRSDNFDINRQFQTATSCYLPQVYTPRFALEIYTNQCDFLISAEYLVGNIKPEDLKEFFIFLGVREEINLSNLSEFINSINQSATPQQAIAFTRWVFSNFFLEKSVDTQEKALKALDKLQVFSIMGARLEKKLCYLADAYEPAQSLEQHAPAMNFLAPDYMDSNQSHKAQWRSFFTRLGVHQNLVVIPHKNLYRNGSEKNVEGVNEYFSYLEKTVNKLYPSNTYRYLYQHYITFFLEIPCADTLCLSTIFWQILSKHWEIYTQYHGDGVRYYTARSEEIVPSNIQILIGKAIETKYGAGKQASDFYPLVVQEILGQYVGNYPIAEITSTLTLEQTRLLGFKTKIPLEDCASLLTKIASANNGQEEFSIIIFLYQQILTYIKEGHEDFKMFENILLLTDAGNFITQPDLFYLKNDFLHLTNPNARIFKTPKSFSHQDIEQICRAFSIQCIEKDNIKLEVNNTITSTLGTVLHEKWEYVLNIILNKKDLTEKKLRSAEASKYLEKFIEKFSLLKIYASESLQCYQGTIIRESIDLWIDEANLTIYHTEPLIDMEHEDKLHLYHFLYKHFQLANDIDKDTFLSLMCATSRYLNKKYSQKPSHWTALNTIEPALDIQQQIPSALSVLSDAVQFTSNEELSSVTNENIASELILAETTPELAQIAISDSSLMTYQTSSSSFFPQKQSFKRPHSPVLTSEEFTRLPPKRLAFLSDNFESRDIVGKRGERFVYDYLLKKHQEKYGVEKIKENDQGYVIQIDNYTKTVCWLNKTAESYQQYDFEITVAKNDQRKIRRLEVKATRSLDQSIEINYSLGEWEQVKNVTENNQYKLYVVRGINLEDNAPNINLQIIKQDQLLSLKSTQYLRVSIQ